MYPPPSLTGERISICMMLPCNQKPATITLEAQSGQGTQLRMSLSERSGAGRGWSHQVEEVRQSTTRTGGKLHPTGEPSLTCLPPSHRYQAQRAADPVGVVCGQGWVSGRWHPESLARARSSLGYTLHQHSKNHLWSETTSCSRPQVLTASWSGLLCHSGICGTSFSLSL